ncbi:MAG: hypothetical protein R3324_04715 [Halobacteriales archaeon]|nr:hypothetical protein [Halobacteriales archaeon]
MSESGDTNQSTEAGDTDRDNEVEAAERALNDLPDGSGCAEIWDYLSERRRQD